MSSTTAIALSGGIDSLVSAELLKRRGHRLVGVHFLTGYETEPGVARARARLRPVAEALDIPVEIIDLRREFRTRVVDYFTAAYRRGATPNPCMQCNPTIKFGALWRAARGLGAHNLATGHYARLEHAPGGRPTLLRGADDHKDQSYFLARLNRHQLERALFPLGSHRKTEVCALAREMGLEPVTERESQDICFVRGNYAAFFERTTGTVPPPGPIVDRAGRRLGEHNGLHRFTVGQRRGINCPATAPYYVIALDVPRNTLVVGPRSALRAAACRVSGVNWLCEPPRRPLRVEVRIRYRHRAATAFVTATNAAAARIVFDLPQNAVTPGQGAVFYQGCRVLGGGWICSGDAP